MVENWNPVSLQDAMVCGSWIVEGLTDLKIVELVLLLKTYDIDVLCQEVRKGRSLSSSGAATKTAMDAAGATLRKKHWISKKTWDFIELKASLGAKLV